MEATEINEKLAEQSARYEAMIEFRTSRAYHHTEIKHDPEGWQGQTARVEFHEHSGLSYSVTRLTPVEALELRNQLNAYLSEYDYEAELVRQSENLAEIRERYSL